MNWIFLAILAHFFWAWVNIGDKYIVGKRVKNPYVYMVWLTLTGIVSIFVIPFVDFRILDWQTMTFLIVGALFYFFGGLPYIRAMQIEEPTRINVWWNLIPLISLIIGFSFFNERLNAIQLLAFVLLIIGAFVASLHARNGPLRFSRAFVLMMISTLAFAIYGVLFSRATQHVSFWQGFVWVHLVMVVASFTLFLSRTFRKDFKEEIRRGDKTLWTIFVGVALVDRLGILLNQWALSLSSAALVYAFEGTQVLFVFLIALFLSWFYPHIVKEEIDRKNLILKLIALVFMIVGVLVLNLA